MNRSLRHPKQDSTFEKFDSFSSDGAGSLRPFEAISLPLMKETPFGAVLSEPPGRCMSPATLSPVSDASEAFTLLQSKVLREMDQSVATRYVERGESRFFMTPEPVEPDYSWDLGQLAESFGPRPVIEKEPKEPRQPVSGDVSISGKGIHARRANSYRPLTAEAKRSRSLRDEAPPTAPFPDSPLSRKITERRIRAAQASAQQNDPALSPVMAETLKQTLRKALAREAF